MNRLIAFLIIPFSGYFITKLPLSPIYFFLVAGGALYFLYFMISLKFPIKAILPLAYFIFILTSQYLIGGDFETTILVLVSISFYIITICIIDYLTISEIIKLAEKLVWYSIPLLVIEAIWRLSHPNGNLPAETLEGEDVRFYMYKVTSLMYQDSNFVGIFIITLFGFCYYLQTISGKTYSKERLILFILTILTLCRAAIIIIFGFLLVNFLLSKFSNISKKTFIYIGLIMVLFVGLVIFFIGNDVSFQSKFMIISLASKYIFENAPLHNILFGVGFGNTKYVIGIGSHNFFVTYIMESGIIGFIFIMIIWVKAAKDSNYKLLYIILPFLGVGMSLAGHAIPYVYVIFAIVVHLENYKLKGELTNKVLI